jgi:hypothetical protein
MIEVEYDAVRTRSLQGDAATQGHNRGPEGANRNPDESDPRSPRVGPHQPLRHPRLAASDHRNRRRGRAGSPGRRDGGVLTHPGPRRAPCSDDRQPRASPGVFHARRQIAPGPSRMPRNEPPGSDRSIPLSRAATRHKATWLIFRAREDSRLNFRSQLDSTSLGTYYKGVRQTQPQTERQR